MKVSVLVPIYNVERFLRKCLDSLASQTLVDMEIICINDGSTDSCKEIIDTYVLKDNRFRLIDKPNTGYGDSMNVGLSSASGEYIAIVESDDYIEPDMMEKLYNIAREKELDIIKSSCFFYSDKNGQEENQYVNIFENLKTNDVFCPMERKQIFLGLQTIWSSLYKRQFLLNEGIEFNNTPGASYQDVSFAFQVFACAKRVLLIPDAFYHYRISNMNSSVKSPNKVFCICDELEKIDAFIADRKKDQVDLRIIASRLGYRVLFENFHSLSEAYQYALYVRIVDYLKKYKEMGYMTGELWSDSDIQKVNILLSAPNDYFMKIAKSYKDERIHSDVCINDRIYVEAICNCMISYEHIIIYGAGKIGNEVADYLLRSNVDKKRIRFVVTKKENNPSEIHGIKVHDVNSLLSTNNDAIWLIAMKDQFQYEIANMLNQNNISRVIVIDQRIREHLSQSFPRSISNVQL